MALSVEGNVGSGMEAVMDALSKEFVCVKNPMTNWDDRTMEREFRRNPRRWAFTYQTRKLMKRPETKGSDELKVVHGSVRTDRDCFSRACLELGYMSPIEFSTYCSIPGPTQPEKSLYFRSNPNRCHESLIQSGDTRTSADFIQVAHRNLEKWAHLNPSVVVLDAERFREVAHSDKVRDALISAVRSCL